MLDLKSSTELYFPKIDLGRPWFGRGLTENGCPSSKKESFFQAIKIE